LAASRLIAARQNRFFTRIAAADSQLGFRFVRCADAHDERSMYVRMRSMRGGGGDAGVTSH